MSVPLYVYRIRKNVPGVGRMLANELGGYEVSSELPTQALEEGGTILNYGRSTLPEWAGHYGNVNWINHPHRVLSAVNKADTLMLLNAWQVPHVTYYLSADEALEELERGGKVFARKTLTGKKGKGIVIMNKPEDLVEAPLYTVDFGKTHEFRVHVAFGKVIDYVQKKRVSNEVLEERGWTRNDNIRNRKNGWIFAHQKRIVRDEIKELGIKAARALNLDFAGVDILADFIKLDEPENGSIWRLVDAVVCEVNSAPGMSAPTTKAAYLNAFKEFLNE